VRAVEIFETFDDSMFKVDRAIDPARGQETRKAGEEDLGNANSV
jgi:hypothetical protein